VTRNVRLLVAYDGTDFRGFAENEGVRTVMGVLRHAVETVVRGPVELTGAGRTDAGVHGWGQVVSGLVPDDTDLRRLTRSVNGICAPEVVVRSASWADDEFSARFSATSRTYQYDVWNAPHAHPLLTRWSWHVPRALDLDAMAEAAAAFVGEHDFSSFCRRPTPVEGRPEPSLVRRVERAHWSRVADDRWGSDLVRFEIRATSFCHQMVRSIVGTSVDVGLGRRPASSIAATLAARDRSTAGQVAPPHGLVLMSVGYEGERWDESSSSSSSAGTAGENNQP
jgi:tRNA pseudouridine38-40 synthase